MKHILASCCLAVLLGCARQDQLGGSIRTDQLIEAFITYVQKAEGRTLDADQRQEMRNDLEKSKADALLQPYLLEDKDLDRQALMDKIAKGIEKWLAAGITLNDTSKYASDKKNLEALSDAELVMAFRLVDQIAGKLGRD